MEERRSFLVAGVDPDRAVDAIFINAPLRDYGLRPRVNDFTLPVMGMGYIATYAAAQGFNVGVLDAESHGLGIAEIHVLVNHLSPRWAGFNLLAPTYDLSAKIAQGLDPKIDIMLGGHQAKAMPLDILRDPRFARTAALVIGEGETRVVELLTARERRRQLPNVMWLEKADDRPVIGTGTGDPTFLRRTSTTCRF